MEQKIEGQDVYGDPWNAALPPPGEALNDACVRLGLIDRGDLAIAMLDERNASRLGAFLLSASGVKVVDAVRQAVAANEAAERMGLPYANGKRRYAIDALSAELAKLDALTGDK